jgi:hypothetical protein
MVLIIFITQVPVSKLYGGKGRGFFNSNALLIVSNNNNEKKDLLFVILFQLGLLKQITVIDLRSEKQISKINM